MVELLMVELSNRKKTDVLFMYSIQRCFKFNCFNGESFRFSIEDDFEVVNACLRVSFVFNDTCFSVLIIYWQFVRFE